MEIDFFINSVLLFAMLGVMLFSLGVAIHFTSNLITRLIELLFMRGK